MNKQCRNPNHREQRFALYDVAGIFVNYACPSCEAEVKSRYAPHVFGDSLTDYLQIVAECGERVEDDF